jgi:hypothetical protein
MTVIKLTDLVQRIEYADISAGRIEIRPLGVGVIGKLFLQFPALLGAIDGDRIDAKTIASLAQSAPAAIPAIIAHGCGMPGPAGEKAVERLTPADQMTILAKIFEVSFPEGLASFFDSLGALMGRLGKTRPAAKAPEDSLEVVDRLD